MIRRILSPSIALVCLGWLFLFLLASAPAGTALAQENVADWTLGTSTGQTVNFHETLAKGPVVLNFWATWCKPCLKEMPHMNRMAGEYAGQVTFLAVNTDNSKAVAKVAPLIQAKGYDNLIVPLDTGAEVQQLLQVGGILPFTIVFDEQGREIYRHIGYKEGDEEELQAVIEDLLAHRDQGTVVDTGKPDWGEAVTATDRFEYSYSGETRREIFENWLDVSYQFGGFRTGIMLNSQAPSEEGERSNTIKHRFFEFKSSNVAVRAGHFYGIFGRGVVFNAYEDRVVRVDTRLDGLMGSLNAGNFSATAFSGTPSLAQRDIRAADFNYAIAGKVNVAVTGMTYRPDEVVHEDDSVNRHVVGAARASQNFGFGDYYIEYGEKQRFDFPTDSYLFSGKAVYGNLNFYNGPFSISWETSDYDRFELIPRADGVVAMNRPPSLAREFAWTLMNRAPHTLNANDEVGNNLDLMYSDDKGWTLLASGASIEAHDGRTIYELAYGLVEKERVGDFRLKGAFGYQDSEGLRQTAMGEITWLITPTQSLDFQIEHQHVRLGGGHGFNLGAYDEQWFKLEYETAPRWAFAAILELNNKYDEQRQPGEKEGPFPAGQVTYTISRGGNLNLWFGKRQSGFLCSGGVCKFEPAFEGVEVYGVFRY